ncbi:hypothetical protein [Anaerobacillus arseniciselenatis]|uniref:hypothetical protein n=1 Tax=Anaerobacillus arseniciselenatis TaxID=85682 RepID=UPI00147193F4|nr:hypothetical protein [Anaerobacillus arseniciselenatis]
MIGCVKYANAVSFSNYPFQHCGNSFNNKQIQKKRGYLTMTEHAEIAGFLQVKICDSEADTNEWLQENGDLEIVEIKFAGSETYKAIMIIYRVDA